ncbi:hypothetical protein AWB75_04732 [Caballeronia catudaia]|uniref:Uncharacterized protein n=1 Tax=Caballeronia catudaia TaxID=1777136 RepID=A0A158C917_9BURK|nr:DUF2946 domain-containing protein [Caballeronia catudaia]SAK78833.1 hypothetical protein AWB75_04732 [Caballeronia catudaia]
MTRNARNRFVAWLGIAAMWLAIVAPVISQTLAARAAASDPQAVLCAVDASGADAHEGHHAVAQDDTAHAGHHAGASHSDACSYCGLLAHNLPLAIGLTHDVVRIERVTRTSTFADIDTVVSKSFNAASPRAPPALS